MRSRKPALAAAAAGQKTVDTVVLAQAHLLLQVARLGVTAQLMVVQVAVVGRL
jgi:hypothetical protein